MTPVVHQRGPNSQRRYPQQTREQSPSLHKPSISKEAEPGPPLTLKLYWRSEASLPLDYTVFVHVRNEAGETVAQKDQPPLQGAYPTSLWDPGEIIADEVMIPLPPDLQGDYEIVVGLYDFKTGVRLPVPGRPANEVSLGWWFPEFGRPEPGAGIGPGRRPTYTGPG